MKIVFMRHGKPDVPELGNINVSEFHRWIEAYNSASLDITHKPSKQVVEIANHCNVIVCSDLRRSIESAQLLGIRDIHCIDVIFKEVELPYARLPSPRLMPDVWFVLYRILWFMGYATNSESIFSARQRAAIAAKMLHNKALCNNTVFCIGHSIFNSLIAKELLKKGWQGSTSIFNKHWEISEYEYVKTRNTKSRMC